MIMNISEQGILISYKVGVSSDYPLIRVHDLALESVPLHVPVPLLLRGLRDWQKTPDSDLELEDWWWNYDDDY